MNPITISGMKAYDLRDIHPAVILGSATDESKGDFGMTPTMTHTLLLHEGTPYRVQPEGIGLGLAVDVQRKDGSRGLVVPVIKRADTMDFASFLAAYEGLVDKARTNRLMPHAAK